MQDKKKIYKFLDYFIKYYKLNKVSENITKENIYKNMIKNIKINKPNITENELNNEIKQIINNTILTDNLNYNLI